MDKTKFLKGVEKYYGAKILACINQTTEVSLTDIHGNDDVIRALQENIAYPLINSQLFTGLLAPVKGKYL